MNTPQKENDILTLSEILDKYASGEIVSQNSARKCYLTEEHKKKNIVSWIHDTELNGQLILRNMSKSSAKRDLLRNRNL